MNLDSWQSADYNLWILIPLLILGYSLLNAFVIWRLKPLWPKDKSWRIIGLAITLFFVIMPFIGNYGDHVLFDYCYYIGSFWASMVILTIAGILMIMLVNGFVWLINTFFSKKNKYLANRWLLLGVIVIGFVLNIYGVLQTRLPQVEKLDLKTSKLPSQIDEIKIVQISDVHSGFALNSIGLDRLVERIEKEDPDILVSTGDLFDKVNFRADEVVEVFQDIKPQYGKYAVIGNHEVYAGTDWAVDMTEKAGFKVLRDETITIENVLNIAGIDDPADASEEPEKEAKILRHADPDLLTIFLKHEPVSLKKSRDIFDLQLSGHLHGGDFPFRWIIAMHHNQLEEYKTETKMYVSRGWGSTELPISRIGARPEIAAITIKKSR